MNGIIIVNKVIGHNAYKISRFKEEFQKRGISLNVITNDGALALIDEFEIKARIPNADFILYLDKDIYLARMLEKAGYRLFNRADFLRFCDDKMLTQIGCSNMGFRMPKTYTAPLVYARELQKEDYSFLKKIADDIGFPLIVKEHFGSLGTGVYLASNLDELKEIYSKRFNVPLLFQEYVRTSEGKSIRALIIDGKVFGAFVRYNGSDFRSNYGGDASSLTDEVNKKYTDFAEKLAEKLDIEYAGIDLLFGKNDEPILCEINSNAFFEEFEKVTGKNVAGAFADMVIDKIKK